MLLGATELQQLKIISALFGKIYWPGIQNLDLYSQLDLSQNTDPSLRHLMVNYKSHIREQSAKQLLEQLLVLDPKRRIDVCTALQSRFLNSESYSPEDFRELLRPLNQTTHDRGSRSSVASDRIH